MSDSRARVDTLVGESDSRMRASHASAFSLGRPTVKHLTRTSQYVRDIWLSKQITYTPETRSVLISTSHHYLVISRIPKAKRMLCNSIMEELLWLIMPVVMSLSTTKFH